MLLGQCQLLCTVPGIKNVISQSLLSFRLIGTRTQDWGIKGGIRGKENREKKVARWEGEKARQSC